MKVRNAARTRVNADHFAFGRIDLANGRHTLDNELNKPAFFAVERSTHYAAIFHATVRGKRLLHVVRVGLHVLNAVPAPDNGFLLGLVHDFVIVCTFNGVQSALEGLESRLAALLEHVALQSPPDGLADALGFMRANVVSTAGLAMIVGNSYQAEFIQAESIVNRSKGLGAGSAFRHVPCFPPLLRFTHALKTPESRPERRVVEHAAELECLFEKTILLIVYTKREFDDVGRSSRSHMAMLLHVPKMGTPCPLFEKRGLRRTVSIKDCYALFVKPC